MNQLQKNTVYRMLEWMKNNFGIAGIETSRDRKIIAALQLAVLDTFGVNYEEIMCGSRKRPLADKRAMIYKIAEELSNSSKSKLATLFPKNRSTSLYNGVMVADNLIEIDRDFRENYERLRESTIKYFKELYEE
jgi:chromosomal replication initiation ATPase DnaA